jgi:hypothetical protein
MENPTTTMGNIKLVTNNTCKKRSINMFLTKIIKLITDNHKRRTCTLTAKLFKSLRPKTTKLILQGVITGIIHHTITKIGTSRIS